MITPILILHRWFYGLDWDKIRHQTFPAPFVPPIVKCSEDYNLGSLEQYHEDPPDETSGWDDDF